MRYAHAICSSRPTGPSVRFHSPVKLSRWLYKQKSSPAKPESAEIFRLVVTCGLARRFNAKSMCAARKQRNQHHQIGEREQPLIRLNPGALCGSCNKPQMSALCEVTQMIHANACQTGDFRVGEDFLARFDGNHGSGPLSVRLGSALMLNLSTHTALDAV